MSLACRFENIAIEIGAHLIDEEGGIAAIGAKPSACFVDRNTSDELDREG